MKAEIVKNGKESELVIRIPVSEHLSKSGQSFVIATTNGNVPTTLNYKDEVVYLGVNAYYRNKSFVKPR